MHHASQKPLASVVMCVYGDLRFLDEAIGSILTQELQDIEFIIVDDGTGQHATFDAIQRRDPRIRVIRNSQNLGTAESANRGIAAARADIIVRIDADDVAEPSRVGRLLAALEDRDIGLVGSAVTLIDEAGNALGMQHMPETDLEIRWTILFYNPFYHSAVAFRRSCFEKVGRYRPEELVSQDHYLWFEMLPFTRARNVAERLTRYRLNPQGLTALNEGSGRSRTHAIREVLWAQIGLTYDLYDDAAARDIIQFLRGQEIQEVERRAAAYRVILSTLRAFLAAPGRLARADDREAARNLVGSLVGRILASPPKKLSEILSIYGRCVPLDARRAFAATARHLVRGRA